MVFDRLKKILTGSNDNSGEEYLEIDLNPEKKENKVLVKLFMLKSYEETNEILNILREGYTIAIIDIRLLRKKDPIELKRAVSKIKKTTDALEGSIAGFGENMLIVTPPFAKIEKHPERQEPDTRQKSKFDY